MTDRNSVGARDGTAGQTPRLSPPLKVASRANRASTAGSPGGNDGRRGARYWLTSALFLILGAVALAVFLYLPRWVVERSATAANDQAGQSEPEGVEPIAATPGPEGEQTQSTEQAPPPASPPQTTVESRVMTATAPGGKSVAAA